MKKAKFTTSDMILISMFAGLTAIGAYIKIPVPVVPFTLQMMFVYFAGSLLGSRLGAASQLIYLAVGLVGAPVFSEGGGISYIFKPTFGYLLGFLFASYVIGRIIERKANPSLADFLTAHFTGLAIVYIAGMAYLYFAMNVIQRTPFSLRDTFFYGFLVAVPGDIILCLFASVIAIRVYRQLRAFYGERRTNAV
ncbi:biotin transporter BioY [Aneurinibacillus terranovensis]|uniref:biotin transporter BioY n=1 Tax=Aneurinibacillus terranovensis TaxID=278991 RepID=UPI0004130C3F|nr:biotin transporter BioY [Aneurinibacillus terranovensis]